METGERERWRDTARDRKRADKTVEEGTDKRKETNRGKLKGEKGIKQARIKR